MYACDEGWWRVHLEDVRQNFNGQLYTQWHTEKTKEFAEREGLNAIQGRGRPGLGRGVLHHGSNSGYQAINLAYLLGATRIFLLGYDMGWTGGKTHWFGDHGKGLSNVDPKGFVRHFDSLARDLEAEGVEVVNLTRETNLTQFKRASIDDSDFCSLQ